MGQAALVLVESGGAEQRHSLYDGKENTSGVELYIVAQRGSWFADLRSEGS